MSTPFEIPPASQLKQAAEKNFAQRVSVSLKHILEEMQRAANNGSNAVAVLTAKLSLDYREKQQIKKLLEEKGYKVSLESGDQRDPYPEQFNISWS